MDAADYEPGKVRHIDHEIGTDLFGDCGKLLEVESSRIGTVSSHNHLRLFTPRYFGNLVVVEDLGLVVDEVGDEVVDLAAEVDGRTVCQVPPLIEGHAQDRVARLQECRVHRHVGVGTAV